MENNEGSKEENKSSNSIFYGDGDKDGSNKNKLDAIADSQEDLEAVEHDGNIIDDKEATYQNLRGNKNNSFINGGDVESENPNVEVEDIEKINLDADKIKDNKPNTDRKYNEERGGSGLPFEAGNLDSPNSQTNLKHKKDSDKDGKTLGSKRENSEKSVLSKKSEIGWKEENKGRTNEDEKHDEERSLLDPANDDDIYSKDLPKNDDDKEMRRTSTKPERPVIATPSRSKLSDDMEDQKDSDDEDEAKEKEPSECNKKSNKLLDSWQWGIFMTVITIYTLFFDDIRVILIPKDADDAFFTITTICFCLFLFEIILSSIVVPNFLLGFFFWLDVLATGSMLFDIGWIMENLSEASQADSASSVAQSSRAARVTRIVRLVRLIRLVRIVKLYKQAKQAQQRREEARIKALKEKKGIVDEEEEKGPITKREALKRKATIQEAGVFAENDEDMITESKIAKTYSDKTQRILIVLILATLFLTPLFAVDTYFTPVPATDFGLETLIDVYENSSTDIYTTAYNTYVDRMKDYDYPIIELTVPMFGKTTYNDDKDDLRFDEFTEVEDDFDSKVVYSIKRFNQYEAGINIGRTIMVCLLLTISSYIINKDAETLVLEPIERMIERIRIVAKNPMALCSEEEIESSGALALLKSRDKKKNKNKEKSDHENETVFLETSLFTIGRLLGLCFGEAGARIIGNNIASSEIGSDFNPLIPGSKELAIFGFCDIRGFADATEALEQDVSKFVNQIAEIVHSTADLHQGASNKNLGEAFLMVWKLPREEIDSFDEELTIKPESNICTYIADLAVLSFVKTIWKINKYSHILEYGRNDSILALVPNYRVNMGFGLHVGWGIEGAIGSPYKIDASYLSPNVNIAARLEAGTRQYGVSILISGELQDNLSQPIKDITRLIDKASVKGSEQPMEFYTINLKETAVTEEPAPFLGMTSKQKKDMRNEAKKELKSSIFEGISSTEDLLVDDKNITLMIQEHPSNHPEFKREYTAAYQKYIDGQWEEAILIFRKCRDINPEDGPVRTLIHYIEQFNCKTPDFWQGYRPLTTKT